MKNREIEEKIKQLDVFIEADENNVQYYINQADEAYMLRDKFQKRLDEYKSEREQLVKSLTPQS